MLSPNQKQIFHTLSFNQKLQIVFKFDSHYDTWLILSYSTKINQWVKVNLAMWKCESRMVKSSTSRISSHCQNGMRPRCSHRIVRIWSTSGCGSKHKSKWIKMLTYLNVVVFILAVTHQLNIFDGSIHCSKIYILV